MRGSLIRDIEYRMPIMTSHLVPGMPVMWYPCESSQESVIAVVTIKDGRWVVSHRTRRGVIAQELEEGYVFAAAPYLPSILDPYPRNVIEGDPDEVL